MRRFVVPVVLEAASAEEATRFLRNMLDEGVRWDQPLTIPYIGDACGIGPADSYATEEIHLLRDGMRAIAVPGRGA
jgi:hypothetical protein